MTDLSVSRNAVSSQLHATGGTAGGSAMPGVQSPLMSALSNGGAQSFQSYLERSVNRISRVFEPDSMLDTTHSNIIEEIEEQAQQQRQRYARRAESDRARIREFFERRSDNASEDAHGWALTDPGSPDSPLGGYRISTKELLDAGDANEAADVRMSTDVGTSTEVGTSTDGRQLDELSRALADFIEALEQKLDALEEAGEEFEAVIDHLKDLLERIRAGRDDDTVADALEQLAERIEDLVDASSSGSRAGEEIVGAAAHSSTSPLTAIFTNQAADANTARAGGSGAQMSAGVDAEGTLQWRIERLIEAHRGETGSSRSSGGGAQSVATGAGGNSTGAFQAALDKPETVGERVTGILGNVLFQGEGRAAGDSAGGEFRDSEAAEQLAARLRELAGSLRGNSEDEASDDTRVRGAAGRDRTERVGDLVFDIRDRRSRRARSSRHRERSGASDTARAERARHDAGEKRPERVQQTPDERAKTKARNGHAKGASGNTTVPEAGSETTSGENNTFERVFEAGVDRGSTARGTRAAETAGEQARAGRQSASAELARALRERGNADIVRQARVILKDADSGELRLHLKPEGLGSVRIHMELEDRRVEMRILVENSSVKEAFRENIAQLQRSFEADGFTTGSFSVDVEGEGSEEMSGGRAQNGNDSGDESDGTSSRGVHELEDAVPELDFEYGHERRINVMA